MRVQQRMVHPVLNLFTLREVEHESDIALRWVHGKFNALFILNGGNNQNEIGYRLVLMHPYYTGKWENFFLLLILQHLAKYYRKEKG